MADASIALNRFGLGARPGERVGADPRQWLTAQFGHYDPRPAALVATLPATSAIAEDLGTYLQQARQMRQQRGARMAPRGAANMSGEMAPGQAMSPDVSMPAPAMQGALTPEMMGGKPALDPNDPVAQARQFARREGRDLLCQFRRARGPISR